MARPKRTHDWYMAELKSRGIKVKPLEPYPGISTKGLHRCICGNEWMAKPSGVLKGMKCKPCASAVMRTDVEYEATADKILKDRGIKRLGPYVGARVQILFECLVCQHQWKCSPRRPFKYGCKPCSSRNCGQSWGVVNKQMQVGKRTVSVQGYEPKAIAILLQKYKPLQLKFGVDVPIIKLPEGKNHYPDIWIPHINTLVEVKSTYTLGVGDTDKTNLKVNRDRLKAVQHKARTSIEQGFKYRLYLMDAKGYRIKLPAEWMSLTVKQIKRIVSDYKKNIGAEVIARQLQIL